MLIIKIVFFHIYNAYYKNGHYSNDIPHLTAFGIVGTSLSFFVITICLALLKLIYNFSPPKDCILIAFLCIFSFFFFKLFWKSKYNKIYDSILNTKWDNSYWRMISWFIIFLGFFVVGVFPFIFNKVNK